MSFIIGFIAAFLLVIYGMVTGGTDIQQVISSFIDMPSVYITFGGAFSATLMSVPIGDLKRIPKYLKILTKKEKIDYNSYIKAIVELATEARVKGLLELENKVTTVSVKDEFLHFCIMSIVDAMEPGKIRDKIESEIGCIEPRHEEAWNVFDTLGSFGPSFGMLGTLIGLINMLANMDGGDPGALGKGMAVALVTTFYGSVLVNMICAPVSNRLKAKHTKEMLLKEMIMEGVLMIQTGENPKTIEEKLSSYLAISERGKEAKGKNNKNKDNKKDKKGKK